MDDEKDLPAFRQRALIRNARMRLNRIEEMRDVVILLRRGRSQRQIAELLGSTQPRIGRIEKAIAARGGTVEVTPEEIILRATVEQADRHELVNRLSAIEYSFGETAPFPMEGATSGSWDDIEDAYFEGLLSEEEYEQVRPAVNPPRFML